VIRVAGTAANQDHSERSKILGMPMLFWQGCPEIGQRLGRTGHNCKRLSFNRTAAAAAPHLKQPENASVNCVYSSNYESSRWHRRCFQGSHDGHSTLHSGSNRRWVDSRSFRSVKSSSRISRSQRFSFRSRAARELGRDAESELSRSAGFAPPG